jgi:hypothetical protein
MVFHPTPLIEGDFRCFLSTATEYGTVSVRSGDPFVDVASGKIPYTRIACIALACFVDNLMAVVAGIGFGARCD